MVGNGFIFQYFIRIFHPYFMSMQRYEDDKGYKTVYVFAETFSTTCGGFGRLIFIQRKVTIAFQFKN